MTNKEDINQLAMIHQFNDQYRLKFNPDFFVDSDEGVIEEVEKVILSCQRDKFFTIKVEGFEVIEDYDAILQTLYDYEEEYGKKKNKTKDNVYSKINLKDSDIRLLVVHYYIAIKGEEERLKVLIALPRTVDRYYYRLLGSTYSALWQVVDASTYNSSTSSSKKHSVTLKTMFMAVRIYRYYTNHKNNLKDIYTGEEVKCTFYTSYIFKKSLPVIKYIFAKFGFYGALRFLHMELVNVYSYQPPFMDDCYTFNAHDIAWITIPRPIFDADQVAQSFVFTLYNAISKETTYQEIFTDEYWLASLAGEFNNQNIEKGLSVLDSLESIYDIRTRETIRLPEEIKANIYTILRWMIGEFNSLKIKDNLDISIKRVRRAEYIASLYAMKLTTSLYRVSDIGKRATIETIKKAIVTNPMQLINSITKCKLINYRNFVGDLDSIVALKFTYKGISGIGENSNSMPTIYRAVNPSQVGIVDLNSSPPGDPGASGMLVPYREFDTSTGLFNPDYQEPNSWDTDFVKTIDAYKSLVGYKEALIASNAILGTNVDKEMDMVDEAIESSVKLIKPLINMSYVDPNEILDGFPLEPSGLVCYETLEDLKEE